MGLVSIHEFHLVVYIPKCFLGNPSIIGEHSQEPHCVCVWGGGGGGGSGGSFKNAENTLI